MSIPSRHNPTALRPSANTESFLHEDEAWESFGQPTPRPGTSSHYYWSDGQPDPDLELLIRDATTPCDRRAQPR